MFCHFLENVEWPTINEIYRVFLVSTKATNQLTGFSMSVVEI